MFEVERDVVRIGVATATNKAQEMDFSSLLNPYRQVYLAALFQTVVSIYCWSVVPLLNRLT